MFENMIRLGDKNRYPNDCVQVYTDTKKAYKMVDFIGDIDKVYHKQLQREWMLLRSLNHPGIVKVSSWSDFGTYAYYEMEYLPGNFESMWKLTNENRRELWVEGLKDIVKYMWSMGVDYGELQLEDVRILKEMPVLTDFKGAARVVRPKDFEEYLGSNLGGSGGWERFEGKVRSIKKGLF